MSSQFGASRRRYDLSNIDDRIMIHIGLVESCAKKLIEPYTREWDDLISEGILGLAIAMSDKPHLSRDRVTWAIPWIIGRQRTWLRDHSHTIRFPQTYWRNGGDYLPLVAASLDAFEDDDREFGVSDPRDVDNSVAIRIAFNKCSTSAREILILSASGWSAREIGAKYGLSVSGADHRLRLARAEFRSYTEEQGCR